MPIIYFRKDEELYKNFYKIYESIFYSENAYVIDQNNDTSLVNFFKKLFQKEYLRTDYYNQELLPKHERDELSIARESKDLLYTNAFKFLC